MQFTAREDIEIPIEQLFERMSRFETFERAALRRGAEVTRADTLAAPGAGMTWVARFGFRGKPRKLTVVLTEYAAPSRMVFDSKTAGLETRTVVELLQLSRKRTRMDVAVALQPRSLAARLLVQSLKLARRRIERRFRLRVANYARDLEGGAAGRG
ncbi:MAG: SRPBCC family protein [Paracoccaceae bacterium]